MYFVLFVVIIYVNFWLVNVSHSLTATLTQNQDVRAFIIYGYISAAVKGLGVGYTIWFIYYCISNYPYDLF